MSTSETDEYKIGKCPCGNGDIIKSVTTQDNPWSGADIYYRVDCDKCRGEWDLSSSGERLTLRNSLIPSESAGKIQTLARQDLDTYIRSLAEKYFTSLALSSKKAEHAKLVELNIANGSYRTHLENRKRSKLHEVGYLGRNPAFVKELLDKYGDKPHYERLVSNLAQADFSYKEAASKVVTHDVIPKRSVP